jgi:hypothetical protein
VVCEVWIPSWTEQVSYPSTNPRYERHHLSEGTQDSIRYRRRQRRTSGSYTPILASSGSANNNHQRQTQILCKAQRRSHQNQGKNKPHQAQPDHMHLKTAPPPDDRRDQISQAWILPASRPLLVAKGRDWNLYHAPGLRRCEVR